jgi:hypothetical protein
MRFSFDFLSEYFISSGGGDYASLTKVFAQFLDESFCANNA